MRDVYVAGIGITTFGRLEYPLAEIAAYPAMMAMQDSGITEVDVANMGSGRINRPWTSETQRTRGYTGYSLPQSPQIPRITRLGHPHQHLKDNLPAMHS